MPNRNIAAPTPLRIPRNVVGGKLQSIREAMKPKVSQEDLSGRLAALGVTLSRIQITKIENGKRPVLDYELLAISKALRRAITEFFPTQKS